MTPKKQVVRCKTKGQPLVLQRVIAPRKHTTTVRTPTKRKRARILDNVRSYVAHGCLSALVKFSPGLSHDARHAHVNFGLVHQASFFFALMH